MSGKVTVEGRIARIRVLMDVARDETALATGSVAAVGPSGSRQLPGGGAGQGHTGRQTAAATLPSPSRGEPEPDRRERLRAELTRVTQDALGARAFNVDEIRFGAGNADAVVLIAAREGVDLDAAALLSGLRTIREGVAAQVRQHVQSIGGSGTTVAVEQTSVELDSGALLARPAEASAAGSSLTTGERATVLRWTVGLLVAVAAVLYVVLVLI